MDRVSQWVEDVYTTLKTLTADGYTVYGIRVGPLLFERLNKPLTVWGLPVKSPPEMVGYEWSLECNRVLVWSSPDVSVPSPHA